MKQIIQIEETTKQELFSEIENLLERKLSPLLSVTSNQKLTVKEAAEELGVVELTIHNYIKKGLLPALKLGRRVFIKRDDLDAALEGVKSLKYMR